MAHSLIPAPATATPIFTRRFNNNKHHLSTFNSHKIWSCHQKHFNAVSDDKTSDRRTITFGLATVVLVGLTIGDGDQNAIAAGKRPPPPPPKEKKDPTISGVTAKVLASKKRKEAMKEAMAKLRENGKPSNE